MGYTDETKQRLELKMWEFSQLLMLGQTGESTELPMEYILVDQGVEIKARPKLFKTSPDLTYAALVTD
jgi:hypothetical protein